MCIEELFRKVEDTIYIKMKLDPSINIIDINDKIKRIIGSNITASKWTDTPLLTTYMERLIIGINHYNIDSNDTKYTDMVHRGSGLYNIVMCRHFKKPTIYNLLSIAINIGIFRYYNNGCKEDWMKISNWLDGYNIEIINNMLLVHNDFIKDIFLILNKI